MMPKCIDFDYDDDYLDDDINVRRIQRANSLIFFKRRMSKVEKKRVKLDIQIFNQKMYIFVIILILAIIFSIIISYLKL
jgi:hypothetical protein